MGDVLEELIERGMIFKQFGHYIRAGEPLTAINFVWPLLLRDRDDSDLNMLLGVGYFHDDNNHNAKLYLRIALDKNPDNYHARYFYAGALAKDGFFEEALEQLYDLRDRGYEHIDMYNRISELKIILKK